MKSNKICLGTITGSLIIYDLDNNRNVVEKSITQGKRMEVIASSTIRFFDTYLSRIATYSRGDPNIYVFSFNHLFSVISSECIINLNSIQNTNQIDIPLSCVIHTMKFSPDTFYLSVGDYSGGIRLYRFNDIPPNIKQSDEQKSENKGGLFSSPFAFNSGKKDDKANMINAVINKDSKKDDNSSASVYFLVNTFKFKETENFSIIKKEEVVIDPKDKKNNIDKNKPAANNAQNKNDKSKSVVQNVPTEPMYEIKPVIKSNSDITPAIRFPSNFPLFCYSQKKLIMDENSNNNFISYIVTHGFYYSFYGSKNFKYVCLYPLINEKMKNSFKVNKNKPTVHATNEESLSITTSMAKKEKEFVNFIKQKIDLLNANSTNTNPIQNINNNIAEKSKNLEEFSYDLLYSLSCMSTQKSHQASNYMGLGLKDGSILVFDLDLQTDKHLFQTLNYEVSHILIDEGFLTGCSIDGQVHIYDLVSGTVTYKCFHNPYQNYPLLSVLPIFTLLHLVIDQSQRISVYNIKEKNKICKILLRTENDRYRITNINTLLMDCNQEYLMFITEKDKSEIINYTVLDLINFQTRKDKTVMKEYCTTEYFNFNNQINLKDQMLDVKSSYISVLKIKDLILKCYPQYGLVIKKGLSLKKIMTRFDSQNVLTSDEMKNSILGKSFLNNLTQGLSKTEKKKKTDYKRKDNSMNSYREKSEDNTRKTGMTIDDGAMYLSK